MNTPDTEWAVKAIIALLPKTEIVVDIGEGERDTVDLKEVLPYELNRIFTSLLSSRDTYWKERVEETRTALLFVGEKVLKEMSEIYAVDIKYADKKQWLEPSEFERIFLHRFNEAGLQTLDTLLDNLK